MSLLPTLFALAAIHLLGAMVPGPNMVMTAQIAASRSARDGLACAAGIMAMTLAWVCLTLAGVGFVLQELGVVYAALKFVGALYLVWLGARMLWVAVRNGVASSTETPGPSPRTPRSGFQSGVLTNLSNPKSAMFWTSVFVVAVPHDAPLWFYGAIVAIVGAQTFLWYGFVALVFAAPPAQATYRRFGRLVEGLAGTVMIGFGLTLAADAGATAR